MARNDGTEIPEVRRLRAGLPAEVTEPDPMQIMPGHPGQGKLEKIAGETEAKKKRGTREKEADGLPGRKRTPADLHSHGVLLLREQEKRRVRLCPGGRKDQTEPGPLDSRRKVSGIPEEKARGANEAGKNHNRPAGRPPGDLQRVNGNIKVFQ